MRKLRIFPMIALGVVLAAGCEGGSRAQGGDPDQQGAGQTPEKGQGTAANDTAPHRPTQGTP